MGTSKMIIGENSKTPIQWRNEDTGRYDTAPSNDKLSNNSNNQNNYSGIKYFGLGVLLGYFVPKLFRYFIKSIKNDVNTSSNEVEKTINENQQDKPADIKVSGELHHNNPVKVNCLSYNSVKQNNKNKITA